MVGDTANTTSSGSSSPTRLPDPIETSQEGPIFTSEQCLFCNEVSGAFDSNVAHMQTAHGLFIPDRDRLLVDLETLFSYLHLVIAGYHECICCGTQRSTTQAAQQHMLDKGHCRFDISAGDSEYADFYDFSGSEAGSEEEDDADDDATTPRREKADHVGFQLDDNSLRLPSGRIISNRSQPQQINPRRKPVRSRSPTEPVSLEEGGSGSGKGVREPASPPPTPCPGPAEAGSQALTRAESRGHFAKQLATLSAKDQRSLAHLSLPEQRAVLATQRKQADKARRVEMRYRTRLEGLGNKFLMEHFVKDAADKRTMWK